MSSTLSHEIARLLGVDPESAEAELKDYVQFLTREIQTKGKVEIGDVGTFFNSAAGLQFTPHDALAKLVNREYAGLDPVVLEATDVKPGYRRNEVINTGDGEKDPLPVEPPAQVPPAPPVVPPAPAPPVQFFPEDDPLLPASNPLPAPEPAAETPPPEPVTETPPAVEEPLSLDSMQDLTAMLEQEPEKPSPPEPSSEWPPKFTASDPTPFSYQSMEEIIDSVESGQPFQDVPQPEPDPMAHVTPEFFEQPLAVPGNFTDEVEEVTEEVDDKMVHESFTWPSDDPAEPVAPPKEPAAEPEPSTPASESSSPVSPEEFLASLESPEQEVAPAPAEGPFLMHEDATPPPPADERPPSAPPPLVADNTWLPDQDKPARPIWEENETVEDPEPPSWLSTEQDPPASSKTFTPPFSATRMPPRSRRRPPAREDNVRKYAIWGVLGVIGIAALIGLGRVLFSGSDDPAVTAPTETVTPTETETTPPPVDTPETTTADALETAPPAESAPTGDYALVIGSYPTQAEADAVASEYANSRLPIEIFPARVRGERWFRVTIGSYATIDDALRGKNQLPPGLEDAWVSKVR